MACVSRRRFLVSAASVCGTRFLLRGQDEPTFSTEVKVVNLLAIVRTKKGEIVRDLTKADFSVLENGRPQAIRYFSRESDLPLTIGLMVDTSMSQKRVLDQERTASFHFLDQVLREKEDQVFLMQFDMAVMLQQELTSSRTQLEDKLALVDTPTRNELAIQRGGGTLLYDAVIQASRDIMKAQRNRKALIILTDGVDTGSDETLDSAIEAAQRADTLVYSILFSDPGAYGFGFGEPDGRRVLQRLSRETGGSCFEVSKKQSIETIFGFIEQELRSQYSLGFVSDQPVRVSEFRKLQLTARQTGLVVQTRDRYWAQR
ncbi:MAG TPA: VWA domain-containing protein [Bryobacteraceae bacterium]|nr:VWA domain-containing protein [Bryobacteraceae bacterium]